MAVFCLILSLAPIGALAATPAATLLFDLSLEGSTAAMPAVSNKVETDRVTAVNMDNLYNEANKTGTHAAYKDDLPLYKEEAGGNVKYLKFAYLNDSNTALNKGSQVNVIFSDGTLADKEKLTVEMWARPTSYSAWSSMFSLAFPGGKTDAFTMRFMTTPAYNFYPDRLANGNGTCYTFSKNVKDHMNAWNHYVVTREATTDGWYSAIYVNGSLLTSGTYKCTKTTYATSSNSATTWNSFVIGNTTGNDVNKAFEGDIAEFRIYEGALTETEAAAEYEDTKAPYKTINDGLIFDMDISGSTEAVADDPETEESEAVAQKVVVKDTSNSGQVHVINPYGNGTTYPTFKTDVDGVKYLKFATPDQAGSARKMKVAVELNNAGLEDKQAITFEAWARAAAPASSSTSWGALASLGANNTTDNSHIDIRFINDGSINVYPDYKAATTGVATLGNFVSSGYTDVWKHYVFVREWVTVDEVAQWKISMYVNGELINTEYVETGRTDDSAVDCKWLSIGGCSSSNNRGFMGDIADFRMYSTALSEQKIKANYNADAHLYIASAIQTVWKSGETVLDGTVDVSSLNTVTAEIAIANYVGTNPYIFVAAYKGDELVKVVSTEWNATELTATGTISWEAADGVDAVKAFIWNDGMSPLCQPQGL